MNLPKLELPKRWRDPRYKIPFSYSPIPDSLRQWYGDLTGKDLAVYHTISYYTWKKKRPSCPISRLTFQRETNLTLSTINRSLRKLERLGLIRVIRHHRRPSEFQLNSITR